MIPMTLDAVARVVGARIEGDAAVSIAAVTTDSRDVPPSGDALFIALRGEHTDGHDHLDDAARNGATAALVDHRPASAALALMVVDDTRAALELLAGHVREVVDPIAIGVTGSVGKTTVKDLTAAALGASRRVVASRGSFNNEIGVPLTLLSLEPDTEALVAEIGARHRGDVAPLARLLRPDVAVVTAVASAHLEPFGSLEAVARTKAELVDALDDAGTAVLNVEWPLVADMARRARQVVRVGHSPHEADVFPERLRLDEHGRATVEVASPWGRVTVRAPLAGRHQAVNAMLALAVAGVTGVNLAEAAEAIANAPTSPWRGQVVSHAERVVIDDAYNANPASMRAALDTLLAVAGDRPTTAVLGVMAELGAVADDEHRRLGAHVAELGVDRLVVVGAEGAAIGEAARDSGHPDVVEVGTPAEVVRFLTGEGRRPEVVLVKGSRVAGLDAVVDVLLERGGHDTTAGKVR